MVNFYTLVQYANGILWGKKNVFGDIWNLENTGGHVSSEHTKDTDWLQDRRTEFLLRHLVLLIYLWTNGCSLTDVWS